MVDLALRHGHGSSLLRDIAIRQEVSEKYLWQLAASLKRAGLVRAIRGAKGGFELAKFPREVNLKDIFVALEGDIEFIAPERKVRSGLSAEPILAEFWRKLSKSFSQALTSTTLEDLVERFRSGDGLIDYVI
jgi:Rrf2 family cysteine metabolism transcriptional repressor